MAPFSIILVGEFCVTIYSRIHRFGIFTYKTDGQEPDYDGNT